MQHYRLYSLGICFGRRITRTGFASICCVNQEADHVDLSKLCFDEVKMGMLKRKQN